MGLTLSTAKPFKIHLCHGVKDLFDGLFHRSEASLSGPL